MIEGTVKRVESGSAIVDATNEAFRGISENAGKAGNLVAEIATASDTMKRGEVQYRPMDSRLQHG
jgi:methyl-accepting chemotaxis protein